MAIGRRRGGKSVGKCLKERCADRPGVVKQRSERKRRECGCSIFSAPTVAFAVSSFIYVLPPRFYYVSWKFFARIYPSLELLFARDVATILRINEYSLLSRREETFFSISSFSLSLSFS